MNRSDYLIDLNYPLNYELLKKSAQIASDNKIFYQDSRYNNRKLSNWLISKYSDDYITQIMKDFDIIGSPRFYWLDANTMIPPHIDNETTCSINFLLSDNLAAVNFESNQFYYRQCLLNTKKIHWVSNGNSQRILFKISVFNETYQQLASRIRYRQN
jgi:hypothetical protein